MSAMELYAVQPDGAVVGIGDARNAWGGAMHIWNSLYRKWGFGDSLPLWRADETTRFWEHVSDPGVAALDRVMMLWTFDLAMVARENVPRFVADLRRWWGESGTARDVSGGTYAVVDTIPRAASLIEAAFTEDASLRALLVNHTSVNADYKWETYDATCSCEVDDDYGDEEKVCRNFDHYQSANEPDKRFMDVYAWAEEIAAESVSTEPRRKG